MARGINKVILVGNLGQDPEVRYSQSGSAVTNVSLATSETWKDKDTGEQKDRVEWHRLIFFNRLAEIAGNFLKKGSKIYAEGSLQTRKWEDQNGQTRYTTEIVVKEMQMLDSKDSGQYADSQQQSRPSNQQSAPAQNQQQNAGGGGQRPQLDNDFDDSIPF